MAAHELGHFVLHDETTFMIRPTEAGFGGQARPHRVVQGWQAEILAHAATIGGGMVGCRNMPTS